MARTKPKTPYATMAASHPGAVSAAHPRAAWRSAVRVLVGEQVRDHLRPDLRPFRGGGASRDPPGLLPEVQDGFAACHGLRQAAQLGLALHLALLRVRAAPAPVM